MGAAFKRGGTPFPPLDVSFIPMTLEWILLLIFLSSPAGVCAKYRDKLLLTRKICQTSKSLFRRRAAPYHSRKCELCPGLCNVLVRPRHFCRTDGVFGLIGLSTTCCPHSTGQLESAPRSDFQTIATIPMSVTAPPSFLPPPQRKIFRLFDGVLSLGLRNG
jgi:hypothetical protein